VNAFVIASVDADTAVETARGEEGTPLWMSPGDFVDGSFVARDGSEQFVFLVGDIVYFDGLVCGKGENKAYPTTKALLSSYPKSMWLI